MIHLTINHHNIEVQPGISILEACKTVGAVVPRFCYHETLSIAGNCRVCLVEVEGIEKPVASCLTEVSENMVVYTDSYFVKKARENVIETLLLHHPLDCPVCDQAGECDLQDQTKAFANDQTKYFFQKRGVEDKHFGALIKTIMTRCIHCTRCVRYSSEVAGVDFLGTLNRGSATEIGGYAEDFFKSEISGNVIDLCPVGAITARPFGFKARPWELRMNETIDTADNTGSNVYVYFKEKNISRVLPKNNNNINGQIITDIARFSYDAHSLQRQKHIENVATKNLNNKFVSWSQILNKIEDIFNKKKVLFNVNDNIGFETLEILKNISFINKSFSIGANNGKILNGNSYIWGLSDAIKSIDSCDTIGLTFSVNPKVECATINARIRTQSLNSLLSLVNMNMNFKNNITTSNINLNMSTSMRLFEGKDLRFMKRLYSAKSPLILIGESVKKRGINTLSLITFLKHRFNNLKVLKPNVSVNSEALEFLNIPLLTRRRKLWAENQFCLNLGDNLNIRKSVYGGKNEVMWFDTHKIINENLKSKVNSILPILSEYEENKSYLNLEQRLQQTKYTFKKYYDARSLKKLFLTILDEYLPYYTSKDLRSTSFCFEMIDNTSLYNNIVKKFQYLTLKDENKINFASKYPHKALVNNYFSSTKKLKYSVIMRKSASYNVTGNYEI